MSNPYQQPFGRPGAPPSSVQGPPLSQSFGQPFGMRPGPPNVAVGGPPTTMPPPTYGAPAGIYVAPPSSSMGMQAPPASTKPVQFYSLAGGAPKPSAQVAPTSMAGPPMTGMPPPPPSALGYGYPPGGPTMGPPPTGHAMGPPTAAVGMAPPGGMGMGMGMGIAPPPPGGYQGHGPPPSQAGFGYPAPGLGSTSSFTTVDQSAAPSAGPGQAPLGPQQEANSDGTVLPAIDEIDMSIQCDPKFMRATVSKLVNTQNLLSASKVPVGIVCRPMAGDRGCVNASVDLVDFGSTGIIRCKRCRGYINPFAAWTDNGRRWR